MVRFLHTNDFHGSLDSPRLQALKELRSQADLYFDSGDCIRTGNLGVPMRPEPIWQELAALGISASVPGNRESHVLEAAFRAKIAGATHPIVCCNLRRRDGSRPLPGHVVLTTAGLRIGVFGVMVPMVTERMKTQSMSAFLWDPPQAALERETAECPEVDVRVLLSHLGIRADREIAERGMGFDIIFGGHSHTVLESPERIGNTFIVQGGSHGRYAGLYEWTDGELRGRLRKLTGV